MNKERRQKVEAVKCELKMLAVQLPKNEDCLYSSIVNKQIKKLERIYEEEEIAMDNTPDNLKETTRYESMEDNLQILDEALSELYNCKDKMAISFNKNECAEMIMGVYSILDYIY